MIRYCENDMYAQSMVKASIRLPRSCSRPGATASDIGRRSDIQTTMTTSIDSVARPSPTTTMAP